MWSWTSKHVVSMYQNISEVNVTHHEVDDNCRKNYKRNGLVRPRGKPRGCSEA